MQTGIRIIAARASGLTLVELMVTMAISAILISMASPTMAWLLAQWHRNQAVQALVDQLQLARSEAIKSNCRIVMCNSRDGATCAAPGYSDWNSGWIVFQDHNADNTRNRGETMVASTSAQSGVQSMASSNKVRRYVFQPNGLMSYGMSSLVVKPTYGHSTSVVVSRIGRIRISEHQN